MEIRKSSGVLLGGMAIAPDAQDTAEAADVSKNSGDVITPRRPSLVPTSDDLVSGAEQADAAVALQPTATLEALPEEHAARPSDVEPQNMTLEALLQRAQNGTALAGLVTELRAGYPRSAVSQIPESDADAAHELEPSIDVDSSSNGADALPRSQADPAEADPPAWLESPSEAEPSNSSDIGRASAPSPSYVPYFRSNLGAMMARAVVPPPLPTIAEIASETDCVAEFPEVADNGSFDSPGGLKEPIEAPDSLAANTGADYVPIAPEGESEAVVEFVRSPVLSIPQLPEIAFGRDDFNARNFERRSHAKGPGSSMVAGIVAAIAVIFGAGFVIGYWLRTVPEAVASTKPQIAQAPHDPIWLDVLQPGPVSPRGQRSDDVSVDAAFKVADTRLHGIDGAADPEEARYWLRVGIAAILSDQRLPWALTQLGTLYARPEATQSDFSKAGAVWEMAAAKKDPVALCFLAALAEGGLGQPADKAAALTLYRQAKEAGGCSGADQAIERLSR
jgi:hypothetical protein